MNLDTKMRPLPNAPPYALPKPRRPRAIFHAHNILNFQAHRKYGMAESKEWPRVWNQESKNDDILSKSYLLHTHTTQIKTWPRACHLNIPCSLRIQNPSPYLETLPLTCS